MRYKRRAMRRVALFSTNFLEYSQTFVHEQITRHKRYQAEVFCRERLFADRFPYEPVHVGGALYGVTRYSSRFHRLFRERTFDVVHAHFGTGALYAAPYARRHRVPLVVTFHGYDVPLLRSAERFRPHYLPYALLGDGMLETMALGLCASSELLEMLAEIGVPRQKLRLYHLGIDLASFSRGPRAAVPKVAMVGRFVPKKGFEYGVRAFALALSRGVRAELVLIGGGEREPGLRALVAELGIDQVVEFAGVLPSREVAERLSECDVLMAPSVVAFDSNRESGVLVAKEASACELAVVGTCHGGLPEIIEEGVTGYLVPERDANTLGERLYRVLSDRVLCAELGKRGRAKMEREYDLVRQVAELEERYDEVVDRE
jgi:colanic acid/amylovoran biosynthesis glycosyltransferase